MIIRKLETNELRDWEPEFRILFEKYLKNSKEDVFNTPDKLFEYLFSCTVIDDGLVLVAVKNDKPKGFIACDIKRRTNIKECVIWQAAAIFNNKDIVNEAMTIIEAWAREKECDIIRVNSFRKGMGELLKKYKFEAKLTIYEKRIKGGD